MENSPPKETGKKWVWFVLLFTVIVAVGIFSLMRVDQNPPVDPVVQTPPKQEKLNRDLSTKLVDLRNQAIGNLENHEFAKADHALSEIIGMVPKDPFGHRNLLICRQLALDKLDKLRVPDEFASAIDAARSAVERARIAEPQSFVPLVIASRIAMKLDQPEQAVADLREAMRLGPDAVGPAYDLFSVLQIARADGSDDQAFEALNKVHKKEPHNLFVMKDWLPLVTRRHGADVAEALTQAKETIDPFAETIKIHTRVDLRTVLESAAKAADEKNWNVAERSVTMLRNLVLSESARDKRYVSLDSLEYVLMDFQPETTALLDLPALQRPASKPVHFLPPDDVSRWPSASECHDVVLTDFDLDGRPDLIVLESTQLTVWRRTADDQPWSLLTKLPTEGAAIGLIAFDLDDDVDTEIAQAMMQAKAGGQSKPDAISHCHTADVDGILFGPSGLKLLENKRDGDTRTFVAKSGGEEFDAIRDVIAATVADIDGDGDLDIIASTATGLRLLSNRGNLTFEDISARSILPPPGTRITAFAVADWDRDSDIDILVATATGGGLLENVRHGRTRYRDLGDLSVAREASSLLIGDFDGDGSWDVVTASPSGLNLVVTNRTPAGLVSARQTISLASTAVRMAAIGDFDNDGALDILGLKEDGATIWRGDGANGFSPNPRVSDEWLKTARLIKFGDLDRDGDLDLVVAEDRGVHGLSSQCQETDNPDHGWIELQMVSERIKPQEQNWDKRVNHINLGGLIEIKAGERYQASMVNGPVSHFGLGSYRHADVARIIWTNGIPSNVLDPAPDEFLCVEQKLLSSCPYLYTWNGERFEFVTDLLWNAPLGLMFGETDVAPWREWEYLKIDGQQLKAKENEYQIRVTAELWEAEYFDELKLFAIDHPAGTEIYTNEKVGPAELAEHKIHTVHSPRKPVAARDTHGRDVLAQVVERDGNYTKTFDRRIAQGFTEEHFLELDLGEFPAAKKITLFLTGWMYPGSTSLRVQLSQNPDLPKSRPPALFAPDADGNWREVRAYMGFPGGKTKTIAVDLSEGIFTSNDHRLRIVSTMELFWDKVFFTVDDPEVPFQQTELTMLRAEACDRGGVSTRTWPESGNGPDRFDYARLIPGEIWPAMDGYFTRYGDVLPLLTKRDDHLVVIGSGDEMHLSFAEPAPLKEGWVRDFVIYTVGWDKDADANTIYGECVEPMPFEAMTVYAHRDGQPRPTDPAYEEYLRTYQTRKKNSTRFWKRIQQFH